MKGWIIKHSLTGKVLQPMSSFRCATGSELKKDSPRVFTRKGYAVLSARQWAKRNGVDLSELKVVLVAITPILSEDIPS